MTTADALPRVAELLARHGVQGRPLRRVLALLCAGWQPFDELVLVPALPRRTVEELLAAADGDLDRDGARWRLKPERAGVYRERLELARPQPPEALAAEVAARPDLLTGLAADITAVPPPLRALDHVPATPETVLRRALWLDAHYELAGNHVLFLGDHDLTSLAVCAVNPAVAATVVDLDERVLEFIDGRAAQRGWNIRCLHADLRFGLPPTAEGWADLVFTDPPYTPEGMALFLGHAVDCLRDPNTGRVLVAYGYSERNPALGWKVQQEIGRLGLVFEAILPGFHRYVGAQAVGSAGDLYVLQPTAAAGGRQASRRGAPGRTRIYTHGPQSLEAATDVDPATVAAVRDLAAADDPAGPDAVELCRPGWAEPLPRDGRAVAVDLSADPGPWLLRTLLAGNARRLAVLVGNNHPDLVDERGQRALADLVGAKYRLRFHRSTPDRRHAVVVATAVDDSDLDPGGRAAREVLRRAHGKLGNTWREALVAASGGALTKNQARELIAATPAPADLSLRLIDLPRHRMPALLAAVRTCLPAAAE